MTLPIGIAAGMIKSASEFKRHSIPTDLTDLASHVTFGAYTLEEEKGNEEPVFWCDDESKTSINAVNLKNLGLSHFIHCDVPELLPFFNEGDCKFRINLAPRKIGDLKTMSDQINESDWQGFLYEVEINAACPNHRNESGLHPVLAHDPKAVDVLLMEARSLTCRTALKIAPDMETETLEATVALCKQYGVKTIVSANTRRHSSVIGGVQRLSVPQGGLAGLPLLESGIAQIKTLRRIMEDQRVSDMKIIASGGIVSAEAAVAYEEAGADEGQVATLFYQYNGAWGLQDLLVEMHS